MKGLLDTDGTIARTKTGTRIAFYTSSSKLARQISDFLNILSIKNGISKARNRNNNSIYVYQRDKAKLLKIIKPFRARGLTE